MLSRHLKCTPETVIQCCSLRQPNMTRHRVPVNELAQCVAVEFSSSHLYLLVLPLLTGSARSVRSGRCRALRSGPDVWGRDAGHVRSASCSLEHEQVSVPLRTRLRQEVGAQPLSTRKKPEGFLWSSNPQALLLVCLFVCFETMCSARPPPRPDHVMGMDGGMGPPGSQNSDGSMYSPSRYPSQPRSA